MPQDLEQRYEEFARGLAGTTSRRDVLRLLLAVVGAAAASAVPVRLLAAHKPDHDPDNNSAAAHFCNALFPEDDPRRGECKSMAAHGVGPFFECGGDPTRFCVDRCCGTEEICNAVTGTCESPCATPCGEECCAEGAVCCQRFNPDTGELISSTCVSCPEGQVVDFTTCTCGTFCAPTRVCPEGTTCCTGTGSLFGACCLPGFTCCAASGIFGAATCCPTDTSVCVFAGGAAGCGPR